MSRWATIKITAEEIKKGSIPISINRVIVPGASFVWTVLRTRWPVKAAWMPIWAVSKSRISPTMMISGSWRRKARRDEAKVSPISASGLIDPHEVVFDGVFGGQDIFRLY
jgi:hypothetical protein